MVAVFSPTDGMLGRLSLGSPRSAAKSGYCDGVRPYFSAIVAGVKRHMSETPLRGYSTVTWSLTSCRASRSPVQMSTSKPSRSARDVTVAMTSSASYPSTSSDGMRSAASTSLTSAT